MTNQQASNDYARARALTMCAKYLGADLHPIALSLARRLQDDGARLRALGGLALGLPAEQRAALVREAADIAPTIGSPWLRVRAYAALIMRVPPSEREALFQEPLIQFGINCLKISWRA